MMHDLTLFTLLGRDDHGTEWKQTRLWDPGNG